MIKKLATNVNCDLKEKRLHDVLKQLGTVVLIQVYFKYSTLDKRILLNIWVCLWWERVQARLIPRTNDSAVDMGICRSDWL